MKKVLFVIVFAILSSCHLVKQKDQKEDSSSESPKIMIPQSNCFRSVTGKDSIWLKLEIFPNVVTGVLNYAFYEKDNSKGTLEGRIAGDTIYAEYTYSSEGKESVRPVVFLLNENTVIEGFGEMLEQDGKFLLGDRSKIDFSKGIKYQPVDCVEHDAKFQIK